MTERGAKFATALKNPCINFDKYCANFNLVFKAHTEGEGKTAMAEPGSRVADFGSLSSAANMAMKIFVKRAFTIFASNASFLRVIANLQN